MDLISFNLVTGVKRARWDNILFTVGLMKGPLSEASTYILLVFWMNVIGVMGICSINDHRHASGFKIEGLGLSLA